ncbi:MAG: glycogen/starch synthase [Bacteroidota bacterium]|jgi:starch synthase
MKKAKVLFVCQEITPYLEENPMSHIGRFLPQGIQERGKEIRTFMPRFGLVNERRNQLHEVIRLSGMNLIINDQDHPLIIKVASITSARMQVYFIDNEDYFQRKHILTDARGKYFDDNDERSIFFNRGVIETIRKLGWAPDIIHCHGWFTALMPLYIKKAFADNPLFSETKIVYSVYNDDFPGTLNKNFINKIPTEGINKSDIKQVVDPSYVNLCKLAIDYSDAVIYSSPETNTDVQKYVKKVNKRCLAYQSPEDYIDAYSEFYDRVLENSEIIA